MKTISKIFSITLILALVMGFWVVEKASADPAIVYNAIPATLPPSMPSQPFQAQQTFEFGDYVTLAPGSDRELRTVSVTMVTWA